VYFDDRIKNLLLEFLNILLDCPIFLVLENKPIFSAFRPTDEFPGTFVDLYVILKSSF